MGNIASDLVREALELAEANTVLVLKVKLFAEGHGEFAGIGVMRSDKEHITAFGPHVPDNVFHAVVVARVSVFDGVPDRRFLALFGCEFALFHHVGASDKLDA